MKHDLTIAPGVDPREAAKALVAADDTQIHAVMSRLEPGEAARIVANAPDIQAQTRLIWSMEKPQRAAVVDHLAPVTIASMIQNQERRNRRLLGDVSLEHFAKILEFCSPKQRYYWLAMANSFADVGSNLLVALLPPEEVAEALLTVPEFRRKRYLLRRYIPGGFERVPPVDDRRLKAILLRLAEYDSDRYYEVIDEAIRLAEDARAHAEEFAELETEPIVLPRIPRVPPLTPADTPLPPEAGESREQPLLPIPLPAAADSLMRMASALLAPERRERLEREIEKMFQEEVIGAGGSVAMADLERASARLQAYLRLGLRGVPEDPQQVADILSRTRARDIVERGITALEQLRQIALRLRPFMPVLDARQRDLLHALIRPEATIDPRSGEAALQVPAPDRRRRPVAIPVADLQEHLADLSVWVAITRALGLRQLSEKLSSAPNGSLAVLAALAVSLITYDRWEPATLESEALRRFRDAHFDRRRGTWKDDTVDQVRRRGRAWVTKTGVDPGLRPRAVVLILEALERLEEFLRTRRVISWDRFAPGTRPARQAEAEDLDVEG